MNRQSISTFVCAAILGLTTNIFTPDSEAAPPYADKPAPVAAKDTVYIEEMTYLEVRDALKAGKTTAIIATGGVEQNGPYLEAGKHQVILKATTEVIARKLGNALVAPIVAYVPEGQIDPPKGHMRFPSTLSVSNDTFKALLTDIANSLRVHGFEHVIMIGDSGGNQKGMQAVAQELSKSWAGITNKFGKSPKIHYIKDYYNNPRWNAWIKEQGVKEVKEGIHDDVRHTSIMMTVDPESVRLPQRIKANRASINGVKLNPPQKIIALGQRLVDYQADVTVKAINESIAASKNSNNKNVAAATEQ